MKAGLMLAVNSEAEREENDFYATDPYAVYKMRSMWDEIGLSTYIWECACGQGHLAKAFNDLGYCVRATDLIDRDNSGLTVDFLSCDKDNWAWGGDIVTNPPFKYASEFIEKSMELIDDGHLACFLLKVQFLETTKRAELFKRCGLKYVIVNSERICCAKNGEFDKYFKKGANGAYKGGTQLYCWFVFQKGYDGEPMIKFV